MRTAASSLDSTEADQLIDDVQPAQHAGRISAAKKIMD